MCIRYENGSPTALEGLLPTDPPVLIRQRECKEREGDGRVHEAFEHMHAVSAQPRRAPEAQLDRVLGSTNLPPGPMRTCGVHLLGTDKVLVAHGPK